MSNPDDITTLNNHTDTPALVNSPVEIPENPASCHQQEAQIKNMLDNLPLFFIENRGQMDKRVLFYTEGGNQGLYFTPQGLTFTLIKRKNHLDRSQASEALNKTLDSLEPEQQRWAVKLDFIGANPDVRPRGEASAPTRISYFKGQPEDWKTGLTTYSRIVYPDLWPGIDLVFKGGAGGLKYEFVVAPGADPSQIRLAWRGAENVKINQQGQMEIKTTIGGFTDQTPVAWQGDGERRRTVDAGYRLNSRQAGGQEWGFTLGCYDPSQILVIDPAILDYCGYIGGSSGDVAYGIAVDSSGRAYVTGRTYSTEAQGFPVSGGSDTNHNGNYDIFVARVVANGASLDYCGYIGGSNNDEGHSIAVDSSGRAYVTGCTTSTEATFPVSGGPDSSFNGGTYDAFVAQVAANGASLDYCGYLGGSGDDYGYGIAVDGSGRAYVSGHTSSTETQGFPVTGGPDTSYNGGAYDAFVARVAANGASLDYCGYIGGSGDDKAYGIAVDGSDGAYVTGYTQSTGVTFPAIGGPDIGYNGGNYDAFVARVAANGTSLDYCGYIGGSGDDYGCGIAADSSGRAYVTGYTTSTGATFPVIGGPDTTFNGARDAFVARVAANGVSLDYCGYIGGSGYDCGNGIAVDSSGRAYVAGYTQSTNFPVNGGPGSSLNGNYDAFVSRVAANGASLDYCGYIGGSGEDKGQTIAVDGNGWAYIAGYTQSTETTFPVIGGPDSSHKGNYDIFVARILPQSNQHGILAFTLPEQTGPAVINNINHTVNIEVANGTNPASLTPTVTVSSGATINPASGAARDFSAPVTYTVTAENGAPQDWTVTVSVASSDANNILNFTLPEQTSPATIDNVNHTVNIEVANGTNLISLAPTITISSGAAIDFPSGTARDFSAPVTYTITAENGTPQDWTVNVHAALSSAHDILTFTLPEQTGAAIVDNIAHTVKIEVAAGTALTGLTPTIAISPGAVINPASGSLQDFSSPVTYTVTAENGSAQAWTVTFTAAVVVPPAGGGGGGGSYSPPANTGILIGSAGGSINQDGITITVPRVALKPDEPLTPKPAITDKPVFNDIAGHWAKASIEQIAATGAIGGYADGSFKPDKTITRAEFVTLLVKVLKIPRQGSQVFKDTSNHWARENISAAVAAGIVTGRGNNLFGPDDPITREEMAVMIFRAAKINKGGTINFKDKDKIAPWAREAVASLTALGILNGFPDGTFKPQGKTTRAQAVSIMVKVR